MEIGWPTDMNQTELVALIEACLESVVDIGTPVGTEAGTGKTVEKF